ncbi:MAG: sulfotransferase domain-containing protein [Candidatus Aminicenantes bacterium]|nr:sulfotransferase domain-containing protein [Candidatus Aminicenantes bacterium]
MKMDKDVNYIVSGLERSGTSMLMQILHAGGIPMAFDHDSRPPDDDNPKGYFELEGGKIISKLMNREFPLDRFKGTFVKITAYGLKFLPPGKYKVIYSQRNIEEILDSMEKMAKIKDEERDETRRVFTKLNDMIVNRIDAREDIDVLHVSYNEIMKNPKENIKKIYDFLGDEDIDLDTMISAVDEKLYRKRRQPE